MNNYEKVINEIKSKLNADPDLPILIDANKCYISISFVDLIKIILNSQTEYATYFIRSNQIDIHYVDRKRGCNAFTIHNLKSMLTETGDYFLPGTPITEKEKSELTQLLIELLNLRRENHTAWYEQQN